MKKLDFIYFDAGGGHRAAATALKQVIENQGRPWQVRLVHLRDILDPIDIFRKLARIDLQEIYNVMLRNGWTWGSAQGLRFMQAVIRIYHRPGVNLMANYWREARPDAVVSLVPNFNRALYDAWQAVNPGAPYVTVLTDLADYPPHFWMEDQEQWLVCGTEKAERQALDGGHRRERVLRTSGMILNPRFYEPVTVDRETGRREMGLEAETPTGLVLFGGYGSRKMVEIVERLERATDRVQLVLVCGKNEELRKTLAGKTTRIKKHVVGFTTEIPRLMTLADFFIGKPGPGSVSEAVHMGLPVITERNSLTLPQERYNSEWLEEQRLGTVVRSVGEVAQAVGRMLAGGQLEEYRANARRLRNRAVFEIPELLEQILAG